MESKNKMNFEVGHPIRHGNKNMTTPLRIDGRRKDMMVPVRTNMNGKRNTVGPGRKKKKKKRGRKKPSPYSAETQFCPAARKIDLTRHVARGLSELAENYNIQRKKRIYGDSILRISISTRQQLLYTLEQLHFILDTQKIQINEIAFPSVDKINSSRGFVLHVATSDNASVLQLLRASDLHFNVSETSFHFDEAAHADDHSKASSTSCDKRKSGGKQNQEQKRSNPRNVWKQVNREPNHILENWQPVNREPKRISENWQPTNREPNRAQENWQPINREPKRISENWQPIPTMEPKPASQAWNNTPPVEPKPTSQAWNNIPTVEPKPTAPAWNDIKPTPSPDNQDLSPDGQDVSPDDQDSSPDDQDSSPDDQDSSPDDQDAKEPEKPIKKPDFQPLLPLKSSSKNVPARRISKQAQSEEHYQSIELRDVPAKHLPLPAPQALYPKACNIIHEIYPDYEFSRGSLELNPMAEEFVPNTPEEDEPPMIKFIPHPDMVGTTFDEEDIRTLQHPSQRRVTFSPAPVEVASPKDYEDTPSESEIHKERDTKKSRRRKKRKKKRKKQLFPIIMLTEGQWYTVILVTFIAVVIPYSLCLRYLYMP